MSDSAATMTVFMRPAARGDLPAIVRMLADDPLGAEREHPRDPLPRSYVDAFHTIAASPDNELAVACIAGDIVGVLQLTFLPSLTYRGRSRAQIEGVRVRGDRRGEGIGAAMLDWAIERARGRECHVVQLTTDKQRPQARSFYAARGFVASHDGMKLRLD